MARSISILSIGNQSSRYDGKVWQESIDSIIEVNGELVDGKSLDRDYLKDGDKVVYRYRNRTWKGEVVISRLLSDSASDVVLPASRTAVAPPSRKRTSSDAQNPSAPKPAKTKRGGF